MTIFGVPGPGLELYHIGLTVPDLGVAMEQYTATFGFTWATIHESSPEVIVDGERRQAEIAVTYSYRVRPTWSWCRSGAARSGARTGSRSPTSASGPKTSAPASARWTSPAWRPGCATRRGGRPARFSYHPFAGGLWIELVHTSFKAQLADWIADTLAGSG